MNNSPRMKLLTLCIGAALAQMAGMPALADTAVGVDTANGNASNPGYLTAPVNLDAEWAAVKRTPSGQLYSIPAADTPEAAKGQLSGSVDVGAVHQSDSKSYSKRTEYSDQRNGLYLNNFNLSGESDGARYFTINGGGVGRKDQFYDLTVGKYGSWKVRTFFNETKHVFTDTWKSFYNGEGTGNLTTGLARPLMVTSGSSTVGNAVTCTAAAPCWSYGGAIYSNLVGTGLTGTNAISSTPAPTGAQLTTAQNNAALAAINGVLGTPDPAGLIAQGAGGAQSNMALAIANKLAATPYSELSLVRKKGGVRGDLNLSENLKGYISYTLEKREGNRPLAMNDNNISTEIAEPIDYKTHDLLAGLTYSDELTQANLRASASVFRNNISTMDVQFALLGGIGPMGAMQHATFDLPPDNDAFNLKGEFARSLPDLWKGRFTAAASWGSNRQDDALLAPISAAQSADLAAANGGSLTGLTIPGANPGYANNSALVTNWNTTDALSQKTAKQRIDNKMVNLGLSLRPVDDLSVKGSYRFFQTDNKGGYVAYNPLTNQFGRGPAGGQAVTTLEALVAPTSTGGCYTQPGFTPVAGCTTLTATNGLTLANGSNVPVFSEARSTRQYNYGFTADYDLNRTSSLNGAIEREDFHRNFREREKTWENKVKLGYVNRALADTTLRVSFENDTKRGSEYRFRTFEDLGTGIPGLTIGEQLAIESTGYINAAGVVTATPAAVTINGVKYPALNANLFSRYSTMFRKYDQADRNQKILNTRLNVMAMEDLDVGVNLQVKRADYPDSFYGLKKDNQDSLGLDMNFQASVDRIFSAFYNYQKGTKTMDLNAGIAGTACTAVGQTFSAVTCADTTGNPSTGTTGARPSTSKWTSDTTDRSDVVGFGWQEDLGFARLGIDYSYAKSSTHIAYNFNSIAFSTTAANNTAMALLAGSALPDMTTVQNTLAVNLVKPLNKKTSIRATYRFEGVKITDWHYDGAIHNAMAAYDAGTMLLDSGPLNYHVNTVGVFLNYKM